MFYSYLRLAVSIFFINTILAFMPPTWSVLTYFSAKNHLLLLPTVIIGAIFAVGGRVTLALMGKYLFRPILPKKTRANLESLGSFLKKRKEYTLPFIFAYAFSPIPSNQLFLAAGLSDFDIKFLATSFFLGRLLSYTVWVTLGTLIAQLLERIFSKNHSTICGILIELFGFFCIYLLGKINWKKVLNFNNKQ